MFSRFIRPLALCAASLTLAACDVADGLDGDPVDENTPMDPAPAPGDALDPNGDADGDGLTNGVELAGHEILIDFSGFGLNNPNFLDREMVDSDPLRADTDGDGLDDGEEFRLNSNPRAVDTDGDGLDDAAEVRRWRTSPVSVDSDGDSRVAEDVDAPPMAALFDGAELDLRVGPDGRAQPGPQATSPVLVDTDGDGVSDGAERLDDLRLAVVADLPSVDIELVDPVDVRLNVTFEDSDGVEESFGSAVTTSESSELSRSDAFSLGVSVERSVTIGAEVEIGLPPSSTVSAEASLALGVETTVSTEVNRSVAESFAEENSRLQSESRTRTVSTVGGALSLGLRARNTGRVAFELRDLGITVRQFLPAEQRFRTVSTLQPPAGFDSFALAPEAETGVIGFADDDIDAGLVRDFLANPSSLLLEPAGFELVDAEGTNFVFVTEDTFARTALLVIDRGDGEVERHRVATAVDRTDDGAPAGLLVTRALEALGVDFETTLDDTGRVVLSRVDDISAEVHVGEAPALNDPEVDGAPEAGPRQARQYWLAIVSRGDGSQDFARDFTDLRIGARDELRLVLAADLDRDGVSNREEFVRGSSDATIHSDGTDDDPEGDGLSDFFESRVGWTVELEGGDSYMVFPNPALTDADRDGLNDAEELTLGTDPNRADTDRDGISDLNDDEPLRFVNTAPTFDGVELSANGRRLEITGSVIDREDNVVSLSVNWGDGTNETFGRADLDLDGFTLTHEYRADESYRVTLSVLDAELASDVFNTEVGIVTFPQGEVVHESFDTFDGRLSRCYQQADFGRDSVTDRFGNTLGGACFVNQNGEDDAVTINLGRPNVEGSFTLAGWVYDVDAGGGARFGFGAGPYIGRSFEDDRFYSVALRIGGDTIELADPRSTPARTWTFWAATFQAQGNDTIVRLYRDAQQVNSATYAGVTLSSGACNLEVGGLDGNRNCRAIEQGVSATFDDVRVFDRALSAAQIALLADEVE